MLEEHPNTGPVTRAIRAMRIEPEPGAPGRRLFLRAVAALPLIGGSTVALAAEPHPDAALLTLVATHGKLQKEYEAANALAHSLHEVGRPDIPEACLVRPGDQELGLAVYSASWPDGRRWYPVEPIGSEKRRLRRFFKRWQERAATAADRVPAGDTISRQVPWIEAQARADEIVAAWDRWLADIAEAQRASGYTAANGRALWLADEILRVEGWVKATTPRSMAGLAALASLALYLQAEGEDDDLEGGMLARAILAVAGGAA